MPKSFLLKRRLNKECESVKEPHLFDHPDPLKFCWSSSYLDCETPILNVPHQIFSSRSDDTNSTYPAYGTDRIQRECVLMEDRPHVLSEEKSRIENNHTAVEKLSPRKRANQNQRRLKASVLPFVEGGTSTHGKSSDNEAKIPKQPPFKCDQCGKVFKTKYTLTIHLKMPSHTGARPFVCGICGKGFRLSSTLCRHKIIHTSDKPHKCHICQKAFNRSSTLKTHIRTHSDIKEFMCEVCGKGFHQKGNLRNHTLIHTGEKPYSCNLCEKAFNKLSNLKFHMHTHTDNTPYRCRYCKENFTRRCDLKQHFASCYRKK